MTFLAVMFIVILSISYRLNYSFLPIGIAYNGNFFLQFISWIAVLYYKDRDIFWEDCLPLHKRKGKCRFSNI